MYGSCGKGSLEPRSLNWGDRAGVASLYPAAAPADITPPVTSVVSGVPAGWAKADQTVVLSAADGQSGVKRTSYRVNGGAPVAYGSPGVSVAVEGTTSLSFWSEDNAGNVEAARSATVRIDKTAPTTSCDTPASYDGTAYIDLAPSDALSGVAATYFRLDGEDWSVGTEVVEGSGGSHTLTFYSVDAAGNAEAQQTRIFSVTPDDFTSPVTTVSGATDGWSKTAQTIVLNATDSGSGVKRTRYSLNGAPQVDYQAPGVVVSAQGVTTLEFWSEDHADNEEAHQSRIIRVDSAAPTVAIDAAPQGGRVFNVSASDGVSGLVSLSYSVDGGSIETTVAPAVTVTLTESARRLEAWASDAAGNTSARSVWTAPPRPVGLALASASATLKSYGSKFTIRGSLTDAGVGVGGQQVLLDGGATKSALSDTGMRTTTAADGTFSFTVTPRSLTYYQIRFAGTGLHAPATTTNTVSAKPRAAVKTPKAPATMRRGVRSSVSGHIKPRHKAGSSPIRIYKWRRVNGKWRSYGYVKAKASDLSSYSKYAVKLSLPTRGRWRLRAYHPADSGHASSWSSGYDYVTVK